MIRGSSPGKARHFVLFKTFRPAVGPPSVLFSGYRSYGGRFLNLTTHLHLVHRLRMSGAVPLPPIHLDEVDRDNISFTFFYPFCEFFAVDRAYKFMICTERETVSSSAGDEIACTFMEPKVTATCWQEHCCDSHKYLCNKLL